MSELNWTDLWDEAEQRYRVQTRDGLSVRIWTVDAYCGAPVRGEFFDPTVGAWTPASWQSSGQCLPGETWTADLIPEPRTVRRWVNVYKMKSGRYWIPIASESEGEAINLIQGDEGDGFIYIATVPVEWEE